MNFYEKINRNTVLSKIKQEDIFEKYLGIYPKFNKKFTNPFRKDSKPGCFFKISSTSGLLLFYDYATEKKFYDCFDIASLKTGFSGIKLYNHIYYDLNLQNLPNQEIKLTTSEKKESVLIQTELTDFNEFDLNYWKSYGITSKILNYFNVRKCSKVWIDGNLWAVDRFKKPIFRYRQKNSIKIYRPFEKKELKFRNNYQGGLVDGWLQLPKKGNIVFINKALKDVMSLYPKGYSGIGVRSETTLISENTYNLLSERFDLIIPFMDNDETGLNMLKKYEEVFGLKGIHTPLNEPKDSSDWIKKDILENKNYYTQWLNEELKRFY